MAREGKQKEQEAKWGQIQPSTREGLTWVSSLSKSQEAGQSQAPPPPPSHFIRTVFEEGARTIIVALTWLLPFTVHFPE